MCLSSNERRAVTGIRSAVKAAIIHQNHILLNNCMHPVLGEYYTFPGGGQQHESMEQALVCECLEETGYLIKPLRFCGLGEEIFEGEIFPKHTPTTAPGSSLFYM